MPDVPTGSIPNVRGSQVGCVHFQCLTDATHSTLSCISILPFTFSDDLYEILCRLRGKSLVFSCAPCSKRFRSGWQDVVQEVLRNGLEKIMNGLKSSPYHQPPPHVCTGEVFSGMFTDNAPLKPNN